MKEKYVRLSIFVALAAASYSWGLFVGWMIWNGD